MQTGYNMNDLDKTKKLNGCGVVYIYEVQ